MSRIAVPSLPFGMAMGGLEGGGRTVRIVLTGPGGGTWDQALELGEAPGDPEATVVLDVVDYCRLAARRVDAPISSHAVIDGDESSPSRSWSARACSPPEATGTLRAWTIRPS